jgi:hypothetical protein
LKIHHALKETSYLTDAVNLTVSADKSNNNLSSRHAGRAKMISPPAFTMAGPARRMSMPAEKLQMPPASQPAENNTMAKSKAKKPASKKPAGKKKK